jgi:hypothetical protein
MADSSGLEAEAEGIWRGCRSAAMAMTLDVAPHVPLLRDDIHAFPVEPPSAVATRAVSKAAGLSSMRCNRSLAAR